MSVQVLQSAAFARAYKKLHTQQQADADHAVAAIVADPAIVKRFEELGITPVKMNSAQFGDFIAKQVADWGPVVKAADVNK